MLRVEKGEKVGAEALNKIRGNPKYSYIRKTANLIFEKATCPVAPCMGQHQGEGRKAGAP